MKDTIKYFFLLNQSVSNKTRKKYPYLIFLTIFCSFFEVMTIGSIIPVITLLVFPENLYSQSPLHEGQDFYHQFLQFSHPP